MTTTHGLLGQVITPDHPEYEDARRLWNGAIDKRPAFISRCRDAHEVAAAVRFAVRHDLPLAVRGGGHSIPGHSACDGGLIIDQSLMKDRRLSGEVVHVGPGELWAELDATTQAVGRGIPGGEISDTGVAGLTLGGGVGWLSRTYGLACDNLLEAEVVLADGSIVTTSDDKDPDLIWGLRGGGGNFGVVTRFTFSLNPIPVPMFAGFVMHPIAHARDGLRLLLDIAKDAPDELGLAAAFICAPPAPFVPEELHFTPVVALAAAYVGPSAEGAERVRPLRELEAPIADLFGEMPYTVLQSMFDAGAPRGLASYASGEWLDPLDDSGIDAFVSIAEAATSPLSQTLLRVTGGVMSRIPEDATA
ncbi:MAG: FAD-binding oxidoreductase, partial [Marmoricola sp.]